MKGNYWLDLFTGKTWEEFLKNGAEVTGFRLKRKKISQAIRPGDFFICYITGISRFIGLLEVKSELYIDESPLWKDESFPVRFKVELIHKLEPKTAVPVMQLKDRLSIFKNLKSPHAWTGFFRGSPAKFKFEDGSIIASAIEQAVNNPVEREYDELQKSRTFTIVPVSSSAIVPVSGNAIGWVNRNTIFQCAGNDHTSLF